MQALIDWLLSLDWQRLVPELLGKSLGFLAGFAASWFLLFRRRLNALQRLRSGDSDDFVFQMNLLRPDPAGDGRSVLLFRNVAPRTTVNGLYDNEAAREVVQKLAGATTLHDPVLKTEGTLGFEVLNDALGHIAGLLAVTPFPRQTWLFVMTCEDRQVVRKRCVRCFLIRPADLEKFDDWEWCRKNVRVEKPWHWFRVVALHRIARQWREEQELSRRREQQPRDEEMPLVDKQSRHNRIRQVSLGLNVDEHPVGEPYTIRWQSHLATLEKMGLKLEPAESMP
jgi:hypothetical protein